eukprot:GILK01003600.1.p1 GENE.GILK01003600.1~~GILK01003600.1.p1  ORF type:complete len:973 (+),score=214.48 GILK01003600.1:75-2993(+)
MAAIKIARQLKLAGGSDQFAANDEKGWDTRFHLQQIPQYNPLTDKHCAGYRQTLTKRARSRSRPRSGLSHHGGSKEIIVRADSVNKHRAPRHAPLSPTKVRVGAPVLALRAQTNKRQIQDESVLMQLQDKLELLWEELNIPTFHREAYTSRYLEANGSTAASPLTTLLAKEIDSLRHGKSPIQIALQSIQTRESLIKQLKEISETQLSADVQDAVVHILSDLRLASLQVVETVVTWRETVKPVVMDPIGRRPRNNPFYFKATNYLIKMKTDTQFLFESSIGEFIDFSPKSDPFLVYPSVAHSNSMPPTPTRTDMHSARGNPLHAVLALSADILKRIRAAEMIILEEQVAEHISLRERENKKNAAVTTPTNGSIAAAQKLNRGASRDMKRPVGQENKQPRQEDTDDEKRLVERPKSRVGYNRTPSDLSVANTSTNETQRDGNNDKKQTTDEKNSISTGTSADVTQPVKSEPPAVELYLEEIHSTHDSIRQLIQPYLDRVDRKLRNSFESVDELIHTDESTDDCVWYWLKCPQAPHTPAGLLVYYIDTESLSPTKLYISHLSTANREHMHAAVATVVKHIFATSVQEEIRVNMLYQEEENDKTKFVIDLPIQKVFESHLFRWKTLTQSRNGGRCMILGLRRPEELAVPVSAVKMETLGIRTVSHTVLSLVKGGHVSTDFDSNKAHGSGNNIAVLSAMQKLSQLDSSWEASNSVQNSLVDGFKRLTVEEEKEDKEAKQTGTKPLAGIPDVTSVLYSDRNELKTALTPYQVDSQLSSTTADQFVWSKIDLNLSWQHKCKTATVSVRGSKYQFIRQKTGVLFAKAATHPHPILLIPVADRNVTVFVTVAAELHVDPIDGNLFKHFSDIFQNLEQQENNYSDVFFPAAKSTRNDPIHWLTSLRHSGLDLAVESAMESVNVCLTGGRPQLSASLSVRPSDTSYIVDQPFVFGLTHRQVEAKLDMPLFVTYVDVADWQSV